ncbi:MAG: mannosyl-3-phosphoglycerate synthase [Phycisphaerae bacterium]|nr:mannosyl-3-phosphoglycerate synthase [Phycisphaerae bacterium]
MRIAIPQTMERLGAVLINSVQKVYELDSGLELNAPFNDQGVVRQIPYHELYEVEKKMAIVVPLRNERLRLVEGVLCGIPNQCLTILVSNSQRTPVDRFAIERDTFERFSKFTGKRVTVVHQKDPLLAAACQAAGYAEIVDEKTGLVKDGKAEGMILGTLLARLSGRKYLGFIDADNYFPGAVLEYVHEYAAGFAMSKSRFAMVRIFWHSKPKIIQDSLFFARWGRTSRQTNGHLNELIAEYTGFETDIIQTGNAGEHALTMDLAMQLDFSSGYSIEPFHFVNMFEKFGGLSGLPIQTDAIQEPVQIFQIESRNPHMHDAEKGEDHIRGMTLAAMQVIYHSPICPKNLKKQLLRTMQEQELVGKKQLPPKVPCYPALTKVNLQVFAEVIQKDPHFQIILEQGQDLTSETREGIPLSPVSEG